MVRSRAVLLVMCLPLASCIGCGSNDGANPVPVSGKIMFRGDPVEDARVTFHATGTEGARSASGRTNARGEFSLTTFDTDDGAIPGEYTITVTKADATAMSASMEIDAEGDSFGADYTAAMEAAARGDDKSIPGADSTLPEKYASAAESGITRSVVAGQRNEFTIDLD